MVELTQEKRPDSLKPLEKPTEPGPLRAWSYSALKVYEECPYRSYIQKVKKIQEPSGPAAERGTMIHQEAEDGIRDVERSRGLGDVYKRQALIRSTAKW